ncbi:reverse transcriptase [Labeo rohita]|uniref:Reverse transcriptase n=1 Tax=Labeo rohita TaxID=84645 RepID=A0A498NN96_LABRO|nr:reverse transcriptase [Labeo rohita]
MTEFVLQNGYMDTSVQKGGIPKVPGCTEHTGVIAQLIREAREGGGDLAVLWLDLANVYGSIQHKVVETSLTRHHVPEKTGDLILDYYSCFKLRVTSGSITSAFHRLEKGIITGCTISVILFALAMNMIVKLAEVECRGPLSWSGVRQPPIRAFMDDLTVTTTTVPGCRWILQGLERLIRWARMDLKPAKSRSLVLIKGNVTDKFHFSLGGVQIPSITEKPVNSLGKVFNSTIKDIAILEEIGKELCTWIAAVDKSGLPGKFKAWIYQHGILSQLLWSLLVYNVPLTTVKSFERKISHSLRRWLGLPRSITSIALYGRKNKLQLPLSSLSEEFMVSRARKVLLYRKSADTKVSSAGIKVRTGRKWSAQEAVNQAETRLRHSVLVGSVAFDKAQGKDRCQLVQEEIRAGVEERRMSTIVGMRQQGAWTRWELAMDRTISWTELWKEEPYRLQFLIRSVYDVLPSPTNLFAWGLKENPACLLCQKRGSLEHILSCYPKALGEGHYRWRHDQV